jgi:hypothetical protein
MNFVIESARTLCTSIPEAKTSKVAFFMTSPCNNTGTSGLRLSQQIHGTNTRTVKS